MGRRANHWVDRSRRHQAAAALLAAVGLFATSAAALAQSAHAAVATFGPGDPAWAAFYSHPGDQGTWAAFCAGGHGTQLYNVLDVTPACGPVGTTQIDLPGS